MTRWFNTAGPCEPRKHFMLPASARLPGVAALIGRETYLVVHAPRQCGKTTALLALSRELTAAGEHAALLFSCEAAEAVGDDYVTAQALILEEIALRASSELSPALRPPEPWPPVGEGSSRLRAALQAWARASSARSASRPDGSSSSTAAAASRRSRNARAPTRPRPRGGAGSR